MRYMRSLSRRTFLRGAGGVSIALPFLDEMRTRSVWGAPAAPPARAFNIFYGGGAPLPFQQAGLVGPLAPLAPFKDKMAFLRGIQGPDGHPVGAGATFVGKPPLDDSTAGGPSIDYEIMRKAYPTGRPPTPLRAQGMGFHYKFLDASIHWMKSWDEFGKPNTSLITSPTDLFTLLFGRVPGSADAGTKVKASVLDHVVGQYKFYTSDRSNLSVASRARLADHLDSVRQVENRVAGLSLIGQGGGAASARCAMPAPPPAGLYTAVAHNGAASGGNVVAADLVTSFKVMADLWTMGVGCDLFRSGYTLAFGAGDNASGTGPYLVDGQMVDMSNAGDLHGAYHAMGDNPSPDAVALMHVGWYVHLVLECSAHVLQQLDSVIDPNGKTILDNSFVVLGADLGTNHSGRSVFYGVGQANGKFKPGMYDVQGTLLDFFDSCKAAMGLGGTPTAGMSAFIT